MSDDDRKHWSTKVVIVLGAVVGQTEIILQSSKKL